VIRETQRAFMYFCLYGLVVDTIVVNRLFPDTVKDEYFRDWLASQQKGVEQIRAIFDPITVRTVPILRDEVVGLDRLAELGQLIYGDSNPASIFHEEVLYTVCQDDGMYHLKIKLPFVTKEYVDLFKEEGDLVIRIGSFKRHVFLPRILSGLQPAKASLNENILTITFSEQGRT
jgi:arsenite-transporting ATPase